MLGIYAWTAINQTLLADIYKTKLPAICISSQKATMSVRRGIENIHRSINYT